MEYGILRLKTSSLHRTADLLSFVRVLDEAYEGLTTIDDAIALLLRERELPRSLGLFSRTLNYDYVPRSLPDAVNFIAGHRLQIRRFVDGAVRALDGDNRPARDDYGLLEQEGRLIIRSFRMNSPGFWEFLGSLNPLEVLRQYLNDCHKRRQDLQYGETAEAERLAQENQRLKRANERARLENLDLADQIAFRRIEALQRAGVSKKELRQITRSLVIRNLENVSDLAERVDVDASEKIEPIRGSEWRAS